MVIEKVLEKFYIKMAINTLVNGKITSVMDKENTFRLMEMSMKGTGLMVIKKEMVFTNGVNIVGMANAMKGNEKII